MPVMRNSKKYECAYMLCVSEYMGWEFRDRHKMKEGFKSGPPSVSVSPFPVLGKVDSPNRKGVGRRVALMSSLEWLL